MRNWKFAIEIEITGNGSDPRQEAGYSIKDSRAIIAIFLIYHFINDWIKFVLQEEERSLRLCLESDGFHRIFAQRPGVRQKARGR